MRTVAGHLQDGVLERQAVPRTPMDRPWHVTTTDAPTGSAVLFIDHISRADEVGAAAFRLAHRSAG